MTVEELIRQLQQLDQAGREALLADLMSRGVVVQGDWNQVYIWASQNSPNELMELQMLEPQGGANERFEGAREQAKTDEILSKYQTEDSPGGSGITPDEAAQAQAEGATGETALPTYVEPQWVLDMVASMGQRGGLSEDQKTRILREVNVQYGTSFRTLDELAASGFLNDPTMPNRGIVQAALDDTDFVDSVSFQLPSGDMFTARADEVERTMGRYAVDRSELKALVRMADRVGMKGVLGNVDWQPFVAIASAAGLIDQLKGSTETRIVGGPGSTDAGITPLERQTISFEANAARAMFERTDEYETRIVGGPGSTDAGITPLERQTISFDANDIAEIYQRGLNKYDYDPAMAFLYVMDPALTSRVAARIRNGGVVDGRDLAMISQYAQDGRLFEEEWWAASGSPLLQQFIGRTEAEMAREQDSAGGRGGAGGGEVIRNTPDPVALDEQMRALYQTMFLEEPDEATLAKFRAQINSAIQGAGVGEEVSVAAKAQEFARNDPRYQELYGRKPEGVSEEEYQNQFRQAQGSMLGAELAGNEAVRAGMRSGKYQTAVGAAAGTAEAWDNSTFLGRLARMGEVVGSMT